MRISHQYRFILFANPKCGSSTVRQIIDPCSDVRSVKNIHKVTADNPFYPHMRPMEARPLFQQYGWNFDKYHKIVFVRNPWARLVSLYHHIKRTDTNIPDFQNWLYTIKPYGTGGGGQTHERWRCYGAYSIEYFIKDDKGNILVDRVFRLEDIDSKFIPYLISLGLPLSPNSKIPRKNSGNNKMVYQDYYNNESAAYVKELYKYDIVNFDYQFE